MIVVVIIIIIIVTIIMFDQKASTTVAAAQTDATERELVEDAQWKIIQQNCFTRWTNEQLKKVSKYVVDLETDLSNGLRLIALVEDLSGKRCPKFNKSPKNRTEKLANVTVALKFLEDDEGIKIVKIDSSDIVDHNLKLILDLIWTLIQHYSISKLPVLHDEEGRSQRQGQTPKERLLGWIQGKLPDKQVGNFTTDWNDGKAIGALVNGVAPGRCPDWESWNPEDNVENATKAMNAAEEWLGVPPLIQPADMCNPNIDELSMMTYLSQFPRAKLKSGAPFRPDAETERLRMIMEWQRSKLIELIDSEFGFLDHLLSKGVMPYCEIEKIRSAQTRYEKIGKLLDYIFNNNKHKDLMTALSQYSHSHVANWITANGDDRNEFGSDWPLSKKEHKILDENQSNLIETIDPSGLVGKLYSAIAINTWQREFITSRAFPHEQNVALLDILRRSSFNVYKKVTKCLEETNQGHISNILKKGGAIVTVHATLEGDNLHETETQIVEELTAILRRKSTSTEQAKRILEELKLNIIAVKRGGSIVLYTGCCKEEEFNHLSQVSENEKTKGTLEKLFASCVPNQTIRVIGVKASGEDLEKAKKTFAQKPNNEEIRERVLDVDKKIVEGTDPSDTEKETANTLDPKKQTNEEIREEGQDKDIQIVERIEQSETEKETANTLDPSYHLESSKFFESKVFVFGINDGASITKDIIEINLNQLNDDAIVQQMPVEMKHGSAAAVHCDSIFVTGIGKEWDEIWIFNATSSKWKKCASLIQGRQYHSVAVVDHILYICGGYVNSKNKALDDVEAYDTHKDQCITVGKLMNASYFSGNCVPFKSSLYIFGGYDANAKIVNKVQVYDTKWNECTLLSNPMPRAHRLLRAALWENTVILLGDYCCFVYDFETEVWKVRDRFKTDVPHFGLIISDGLVFVIGGGDIKKDADGKEKWICRDDVRYVPVVNILNDKPTEWKHHAKLPKPSLVQAYSRIDFGLK